MAHISEEELKRIVLESGGTYSIPDVSYRFLDGEAILTPERLRNYSTALIEQARAEVRAEYGDVVPRSRMNAVDAEMIELKEKLRKYYDGAQTLIEQARAEEREACAQRLWSLLMDWCKERHIHASEHNDLFSMVAAIRSRSGK